MSRHLSILLLFILIVVVLADTCFARNWMDRQGRKVEAEYVSSTNQKVRIKRSSDGKVFDIPIDQLSDADQAFVASQTKQTGLRAVKPTAGIPLKRWEEKDGKPKLVDGVQRTLNDRIATVPSGHLEDWLAGLEKATGEKIGREKPTGLDAVLALVDEIGVTNSLDDPLEFLMFTCERMGILFDDNSFNANISDRLLTRLAQITPDVCDPWETAAARALEVKPRRVYLAATLTTVDRIWPDETYSKNEATTLISRLTSLPHTAVKRWNSEVDQYNGTVLDAALNLVLRDELFDDANQFRQAQFTDALKVDRTQISGRMKPNE